MQPFQMAQPASIRCHRLLTLLVFAGSLLGGGRNEAADVPTTTLARQTSARSSGVIDPQGRLWTWGENTWGQLGDGSILPRARPATVPFPNGVTRWTRAAIGLRTLALDQDGRLFAWGLTGVPGRLTGRQLAPVLLSAARWTEVAEASAGNLDLAQADDGELWRWRFPEPPRQFPPAMTNATATRVERPPGVDRWRSFVTGADHALLLGDDGRLFFLGVPKFGNAGPNARENGIDRMVEVPPPAPHQRWVAVAAGVNQSFGQTDDGEWHVWGFTPGFELGAVVPRTNSAPLLIPRPANVPHWREVAAGDRFAILRTDDGRLFGFGENNRGQLAYPGSWEWSADYGGPVRRLFLFEPESVPVSRVAAGAAHGLAVARDGRIFSWGDNQLGQLGRPAGVFAWQPQAVAGTEPPFSPDAEAFVELEWVVIEPAAIQPVLAGHPPRAAVYELRRHGPTNAPIPFTVAITSEQSLPGFPFHSLRVTLDEQPAVDLSTSLWLGAGQTLARLAVAPVFDESGQLELDARVRAQVPPWVEWRGPDTAPIRLTFQAPLSRAPAVTMDPLPRVLETQPDIGGILHYHDPDGFVAALELWAEPAVLPVAPPVRIGEWTFPRGLAGIAYQQAFRWPSATAGNWRFVMVARDNAGSVVTNRHPAIRIVDPPWYRLVVNPASSPLVAPGTVRITVEPARPQAAGNQFVLTWKRAGEAQETREFADLPPPQEFPLTEPGPHGLELTFLTGGTTNTLSMPLTVLDGRELPVVFLRATQSEASETGQAGELTLGRLGARLDESLEVWLDEPALAPGALPLPHRLGGRLSRDPRAMAGLDYLALPVSVILPAGEAAVALSVVPLDDEELEWNEGVVRQLRPSPNYTVAPDWDTALVVLRDDDTNVVTEIQFTAGPATGVVSTAQSVTLRASATNPVSGPVTRLEWFGEGHRLGSGAALSLEPPLPLGPLTLTVRATDGFGAITESAPLVLEVVPVLRVLDRTEKADGRDTWRLAALPFFADLTLETSPDLDAWAALLPLHLTPTNPVIETGLPGGGQRFLRLRTTSP